MSGNPVCHGKFPDTPPLCGASQDDPTDGGSVPLMSSGLKVGSREVETGGLVEICWHVGMRECSPPPPKGTWRGAAKRARLGVSGKPPGAGVTHTLSQARREAGRQAWSGPCDQHLISPPHRDPAAERAPLRAPSSAMLACLQRTQNAPGQHLACPTKSLELRKCE